jgi:hypothetical protein
MDRSPEAHWSFDFSRSHNICQKKNGNGIGSIDIGSYNLRYCFLCAVFCKCVCVGLSFSFFKLSHFQYTLFILLLVHPPESFLEERDVCG